MSKFAWVTLTTNDTYSLGALVLAHSLKRANTAHQLAVLVTPTVSQAMRDRLKEVYNVVQEVNVLDSQDAANLALLARPELGVTFTKLHCWRLVQFEKCVFLDADTLVLQNCDELFEREELSAAPDVSWPDCFNSGVFVFKPSVETFGQITEFAVKNGSFDGGDQGLLNLFFGDWATADIKKHLPFVYNVTAYASYCYLPAFKQFRDKIKILHFAGKLKPWLIQFNSETKTASVASEYAHAQDLIQLWWNIFCDNVIQSLSTDMTLIAQPKPGTVTVTSEPEEAIARGASSSPEWLCLNLINSQSEHAADEQREQQQQQNELEYYQQQRLQHHLLHVRQFRDPWADYYENLEREQQEQEQQRQQQEREREREREREQEWEREREWAQQQEQNHSQDNGNATANEHATEWHHDEAYHPPTTPSPPPPQSYNATATANEESASIDANSNELHIAHPPEHASVSASTATPTNTPSSTPTPTPHHSVHSQTVENATNHQPDHEVAAKTTPEVGLAGALSQLRIGEQRSPEQEAYENQMRRQCWESGQIDYSGRDSFDNIWKKISQTLDKKSDKETDQTELLTSADIEDGKVEFDKATGASTTYKLIEGGYEVHTTTPQPNGTVKTQVRTFWDPKPVSEEDLKKEQQNKKLVQKRLGKEIRIDERTTMLTRAIEGGYEEVYTTINEDGTRSMRTKTFYDSVPTEVDENTAAKLNKNKKTVTRKSSVDSTDSTESSRRIVQKQQRNVVDQQSNSTTTSERRVSVTQTQNIEITENNRTVRKNSLQEQNVKAITNTSSTNTTDGTKKSKKKPKSSAPPPPADFFQNDTTTVASKRVPGGVEYTYSTELESGKTITTSKTVYEEEEVELTEEEIRAYKKTLKDAEKHKNVTTTKKLKSESGTKKIVPSENPGDVTTVETIKIEGGTEYHYTTVTAEGIVKKAVKTVYDPVPSNNPDETDEEEIIEEYEEEIIEPGEKNVKTIETIKQLPHKFEEEVTITHERKEKKVKKSMVISQ